MDVIGMSAFGLKLDTIKNGNKDFRKFGKKIFQADYKQLFVQALLLLSPNLVITLKLQTFPGDAADFYASMFKDVLEYRNRNKVVRNDITQTLIHALKDLVTNNNGENSKSESKFTVLYIILMINHVANNILKRYLHYDYFNCEIINTGID